MARAAREPPAPTPLDEVLSAEFLESSPWVVARIKQLKLVGKPTKTWIPPTLCCDKVNVGRGFLTRRVP